MLINVKVCPGAKENKIQVIKNKFKVYLTQTPEKGKANKKLIDLLAEHFSVAKSTVNIVKGERNKEKTIQISNLVAKNHQNIGLNSTNRKKMDHKNKKYLSKIHCWER